MDQTDWHGISDSDVSFQYCSGNKDLKEYSTVLLHRVMVKTMYIINNAVLR